MIEGLERFITELRREGLAASPGEWVDAMRALEIVGLARRESFRQALRATLAKRPEQQATFDRVFGRFFSAPARSPSVAGRQRGSGIEGQGRQTRAAGIVRAPRREPTPRQPQLSRPSELPAAEVLRRRLAAIREGDPTRRGRLRHVLLQTRPDALAERAAEGLPGGPAVPHARRELNRPMATEDERRIAEDLPRMIAKIRLRRARRFRRSHRGRLYLRRAFRENLRYGGVPWILPRRRQRSRRAKVVLLIDVSWSAARAAGLFLCMAGELLEQARETRILLFVDKTIDATAAIESWLRRPQAKAAADSSLRHALPGSGLVRSGRSFAELLQSLPGLNLDAPSDYGRALHGLLRSGRRPAGRDKLLLVLGDGRTNRFDPQAWAFEEIAAGCGAVIWLVPEPVARWGTGDSALASYLVHADTAVEAKDLVGLARGLHEILRRL